MTMTSSSNQAQPPFPLFDGENYDSWCVKMKKYGFVEPNNVEGLTNAQKQQVKEQKRKNAKALSKIQQGVIDSIFPRIINETKAKDAWEIL